MFIFSITLGPVHELMPAVDLSAGLLSMIGNMCVSRSSVCVLCVWVWVCLCVSRSSVFTTKVTTTSTKFCRKNYCSNNNKNVCLNKKVTLMTISTTQNWPLNNKCSTLSQISPFYKNKVCSMIVKRSILLLQNLRCLTFFHIRTIKNILF